LFQVLESKTSIWEALLHRERENYLSNAIGKDDMASNKATTISTNIELPISKMFTLALVLKAIEEKVKLFE
jgi:hypothetical protein